MKKAIATILCTLAFAVPVLAAPSTNELVQSYIEADQDIPQKAGDVLYIGEEYNPVLVETTGYHYGTVGSHGDKMRKGYCAAKPEDYGKVCIVYEATLTEEGYKIGDLITCLEIKDTGYGRPTGEGRSKVLRGKSKGTIESGLSLDVYYPTMDECRDWMEQTAGMVFVQIMPCEG